MADKSVLSSGTAWVSMVIGAVVLVGYLLVGTRGLVFGGTDEKSAWRMSSSSGGSSGRIGSGWGYSGGYSGGK